MIEDYGTLSEEELLEEISQDLTENTDINPENLELRFEDGKLNISGTLQNEDELELLVGVLENHVEPSDYKFEVELIEGDRGTVDSESYAAESDTLLEETLEDIEGDEEVEYNEEEEGFEDGWWSLGLKALSLIIQTSIKFNIIYLITFFKESSLDFNLKYRNLIS